MCTQVCGTHTHTQAHTFYHTSRAWPAADPASLLLVQLWHNSVTNQTSLCVHFPPVHVYMYIVYVASCWCGRILVLVVLAVVVVVVLVFAVCCYCCLICSSDYNISVRGPP